MTLRGLAIAGLTIAFTVIIVGVVLLLVWLTWPLGPWWSLGITLGVVLVAMFLLIAWASS